MTPLDRLVAERDIADLIHRFAAANDDADWAAAAGAFTQDGRFVRPAGGDAIVGQAAIRAAFESRPPRKSRHLISNIIVDVTSPDSATAQCCMALYAAGPGEAVASSPALIGGFRDRLTRTAQGWRFAERVGFLDFRVDFK